MKEISSIIQAYHQLDLSRTGAALATVARVEGSSYRRAGARMLVLEDGTYIGGISGGCLEGDALRRAQKAIAQNRPSVVTYDTTQEDSHQIGVGLGCNGIIDVLFTPLSSAEGRNGIHQLAQVTDTRTPRVLATVTGCDHRQALLGTSVLLETAPQFLRSFPAEDLAAAVLRDAQKGLAERTTQTLAYATATGTVTVFLEVMLPATHLVVYGGNYDVYPVARIARELGWPITVVMNPAKADRSLFAMATILHHKGAEKPAIDPFSAALLMAHDYETDLRHLRAVLPTAASYIGLLGPRKRSQKMFDALAAEGNRLPEADQQRIYAPAGLDIGAATPEEIALSIVAEIRAHFSGRQGMPLRQRQGTIYGQ